MGVNRSQGPWVRAYMDGAQGTQGGYEARHSLLHAFVHNRDGVD